MKLRKYLLNGESFYGQKRRNAIDGLVSKVIKHADAILKEGIKDEGKSNIIYDKKYISTGKRSKILIRKNLRRPP